MEHRPINMSDGQAVLQAISHDIRDPLRELLTEFSLTPTEMTSTVERLLEKVDALRQYLHISESMLDISDCDMTSVVSKALRVLDNKIVQSNAKIIVGNLPLLTGDEPLLVELFTHLVDNAITHNASNPPVIEIIATELDTEIIFQIRDNGMSIDLINRHIIFCLFQSIAKDDEHLGVGLAFAKRIIERHQGKIWFTVNPNSAGSVFHFSLAKTSLST